jgi:hypothetical protein
LIGKPLQTVIVRHDVSQLGKGVFMTIHHKTPGRAAIAALALGALLALAPASAKALTIGIVDLATSQAVIINDGETGDFSPVENQIFTAGLTLGGTGENIASVVNFQAAFSTDENEKSVLSLSGSATAGSGGLFMDVFHEGFGSAANAPKLTFVNFSSNSSSFEGSIQSTGLVNADDTGAVFEVPSGSGLVGTGFLTQPSDTINETASFVLDDPFAMMIQTGLAPGTQLTNFDATLTAAIPLPASALMLLGGLGGLGGLSALRRRKRAA